MYMNLGINLCDSVKRNTVNRNKQYSKQLYNCTLFTKGRDTDIRKNKKEKERKERKRQPLINSECSSYYPRSSCSTYIRA